MTSRQLDMVADLAEALVRAWHQHHHAYTDAVALMRRAVIRMRTMGAPMSWPLPTAQLHPATLLVLLARVREHGHLLDDQGQRDLAGALFMLGGPTYDRRVVHHVRGARFEGTLPRGRATMGEQG